MNRIYFILILFCFFLGCASTNDIELLRTDIYKLYSLQEEQKKSLSLEISKLKKEMDEKLSASSFSVRAGQADLATKVEGIKVDVAQLEGEVDFLKRELDKNNNSTISVKTRISNIEQELERVQKDLLLIKKILGLDKNNKKEKEEKDKGAIKQTQKVQIKKRAKEEEKIELPPNRLYEQGLKNFRQKNYYAAAHLFTLFIEKYKKHKLIPNAYYWRGECYYNLGQYAKAILNYQVVLDKYKTSNKYPACLLKEGLAFYKLGKKKAGNILLEDLINNFPSSKEAMYAKKFLKKD